MNEPNKENLFQEKHAKLLILSYRKLTGRNLIKESPQAHGASEFSVGFEASLELLARALYEAPFPVLSHNTAKDPVFNYANLKAQELFEMNWSLITRLPSRESAEKINQKERQRLLENVHKQGFVENYSGVRISSSGRRFLVRNAVVWNLLDEQGGYTGQGACFDDWEHLAP